MTNQRLFITGVAAIVALFAIGAVGAIAIGRWSGGAASRETPSAATRTAASPVAPPPPPAVPPVAPAPGSAPVAAPASPGGNVPRAVYSAMRVPTGPGGQVASWERRRGIAAASAQLNAAFAALRTRADACGAREAAFVLGLEAGGGVVRVERVRVEERGAASDEALACARTALEGHRISAPGFTSSRRWEAPL